MKKRKRETFWMQSCVLWISDHILLYYGTLLFVWHSTWRYKELWGFWGQLIRDGFLLFTSLVTFVYPVFKYMVSKLYEDS